MLAPLGKLKRSNLDGYICESFMIQICMVPTSPNAQASSPVPFIGNLLITIHPEPTSVGIGSVSPGNYRFSRIHSCKKSWCHTKIIWWGKACDRDQHGDCTGAPWPLPSIPRNLTFLPLDVQLWWYTIKTDRRTYTFFCCIRCTYPDPAMRFTGGIVYRSNTCREHGEANNMGLFRVLLVWISGTVSSRHFELPLDF